MNQSSLTSSEPIKGEVLRFSRWHTAAAAVGLSLAVVLGGEGIALITVATLLSPADTWFCYAIGVLGLVVAGGLLTGGCYLLTHKPSLVLGQDRLQLRLGKHLGWRVLYSDIAAIALFTPVHASGYRMPWTSSLGIQLSDPGGI